MEAAHGTKIIGMSKELQGGTFTGQLCGDQLACQALSQAFDRERFFEDDGSTIFVEGFLRSIPQTQWLPEKLAQHGRLDERLAFVRLAISTACALDRMKGRYHQNLLEYHDPSHPRTSLRNEEYGPKEDVYQRFHNRLMPWLRDREKIRQILAKAANASEAHMVDIPVGDDHGIDDVALSIARQLGWDMTASLTAADELASKLLVSPPKKMWKDIPPVLVMPTVVVISENSSPVVRVEGDPHRHRRVKHKESTLGELHRGTQDS